jgi:hypothetical protein
MSIRCLPLFDLVMEIDLVSAMCSVQNSTVDIVPTPSNDKRYSDVFF